MSFIELKYLSLRKSYKLQLNRMCKSTSTVLLQKGQQRSARSNIPYLLTSTNEVWALIRKPGKVQQVCLLTSRQK